MITDTMGMSPTDVIRYIHRRLGSMVQKIELSDDEMMRVVFQESVKTFSKYFPYTYFVTIPEESLIPNTVSTYRFTKEQDMEIIGIHRTFVGNLFQYAGALYPIIIDPIDNQMLQDYMSMCITPDTSQFQPPNAVKIHPRLTSYQQILIEVNANHPKHLKTIPTKLREQFLKLCYFDVLVTIYPIRKRFENLETPFASISLFLEELETCKNDREELVQEFLRNSLKVSAAKKIIFG